jgi:hypothetical protein
MDHFSINRRAERCWKTAIAFKCGKPPVLTNIYFRCSIELSRRDPGLNHRSNMLQRRSGKLGTGANFSNFLWRSTSDHTMSQYNSNTLKDLINSSYPYNTTQQALATVVVDKGCRFTFIHLKPVADSFISIVMASFKLVSPS